MRKKLVEELEKELYSKECVAHSINFVVGEASKEVTTLTVQERFSCNLATILARDKEVVAVWLRILPASHDLPTRCVIYLSKNFDWLKEDNNYIDEITNYLKKLSENAPSRSTDTEKEFIRAVALYCSTKLGSRLEKLKNDIERIGDNEYVKSFRDFLSTNAGNNPNMIMMSRLCNDYYPIVKDKPDISSKFLGHIKKVGSYIGSITSIMECARNIQYRLLFSNVKVIKADPVIIKDQPIYSWKNIIRRFIDEDKYNRFMNRCSKKARVLDRINKVYADDDTHHQQQLDGDDVKQRIYVHAEMKIIASLIIEKKISTKEFVAVSKRCCYLCELYIDFARKHGYDITVSGNHKKIYNGWKLPHVNDNNFKIECLKYLLQNLDRIIEKKINHYTNSLPADSDSGKNSPDPKNSGGEYASEIIDVEESLPYYDLNAFF